MPRIRPIETDTMIALGLALFALAVRGPLLRWGLNMGDEGMLVEGIERIRDGQVIYRDFHRTYAPGVYYLFAPLFSWFGPSVVLTRVVWLAMLGGVSGLTYLAARPYAARWAACGAALLPVLLPPPAHKTFVPLTIVLGLLICRVLLRDRVGAWTAIGLGASLAGIGLLRQEVAVYALVIAVLTVAVRRRPATPILGGLALGLGLIWGPVALALTLAGAGRAAFGQLVLDGARDNRLLSLPFPSPLRIVEGPERFQASLFWFPAAILAVAFGWLIYGRHGARSDEARDVVAQWTIMALFTQTIFLGRSDLPHVTQALVAPCLLLAFLLTRWAEGLRRPARFPLKVAGVLACAWVLGVAYLQLRHELLPSYREMAHGVLLNEPRARVVLNAAQDEELRPLLRELRSGGSRDPLFVAPHAPMLYFLTGRPNPTRYDMVVGVAVAGRGAQEEIARGLEAGDANRIVFDERPLDGDPTRGFPRNVPRLATYLRRHWVEDRRIGSWVLLRRRSDVSSGGPP